MRSNSMEPAQLINMEDDILFSMEEVYSMRKTVRCFRYSQLSLIFFITTLILVGPGLRLRQGWRGFISTNGSNEELLECGERPIRIDPDKGKLSSCQLHNHPELKVMSLKGHKGSAHLTLWHDLQFTGQYLVIAVVVLVSLVTLSVLLISCDVFAMSISSKKLWVTVLLVMCGCSMLGVQGAEWFYCFCGKYPKITLTTFESHIQKAMESKNMQAVDDENKIVRCYVIGYGAAASLSIVSGVMFFFDAAIFTTLCKREARLMDQGPPATNPKSRPKPKSVKMPVVLKSDSEQIVTPIARDKNIYPEPIPDQMIPMPNFEVLPPSPISDSFESSMTPKAESILL